jgi:hypothetical protein
MPNVNSGKEWSEIDINDPRQGLTEGAPADDIADFFAATWMRSSARSPRCCYEGSR